MQPPISGRTTSEIVEQLSAEVRRIEGLHHRLENIRAEDGSIGTGCPALDRLLPSGGLRPGTLVEWLSAGVGSGATTLALLAAREACRRGGVLAVLDGEGTFYPPAAAAWQIDLERLLVVRPAERSLDPWVLDQLLRSPGVAAVLAWPQQADDHTFRRWQLAAECGGGLGLLVRPGQARAEPSWAEVRLWVEPRATPAGQSTGRRLRLEVLRLRGAPEGHTLELELDEQTGSLHETSHPDSLRLASSLASRTASRRARGA